MSHEQFSQLVHLQYSLQTTPEFLHSQYFFWQPVFLQLQPLSEVDLRPKGGVTRSNISSMALALISLNSFVLRQHSQLHPLQKDPLLELHYLWQNIHNTA